VGFLLLDQKVIILILIITILKSHLGYKKEFMDQGPIHIPDGCERVGGRSADSPTPATHGIQSSGDLPLTRI
jgi:hypothetical protein